MLMDQRHRAPRAATKAPWSPVGSGFPQGFREGFRGFLVGDLECLELKLTEDLHQSQGLEGFHSKFRSKNLKDLWLLLKLRKIHLRWDGLDLLLLHLP